MTPNHPVAARFIVGVRALTNAIVERGNTMQTITTKYKGWTTNLATRIVAKTASGVTLSRSISTLEPPAELADLSSDAQAHAYVASLLADKLGWLNGSNYLIGGALNNSQFVFVLSDSPIFVGKPNREAS